MIQKKGWNLIPHWFNREGPGAGILEILLSNSMPDISESAFVISLHTLG